MGKFSSAALSWIIIFQIAVSPTALALAATPTSPVSASADSDEAALPNQTILDQIGRDGANDPITLDERAATEAFAQELEAAGPDTFPAKPVDTFHLTGQTLEILKGDGKGTYDLSSLKAELPTVTADFDREISIESDVAAHTLSIVYTVKGEPVAKHVLKGFDVISYARDKEMLQFIDASGKMYVLDLVYARAATFKSPLPVFETGALPEGALAKGQLQTAFITRGMEPPAKIPDDAVVPRDLESQSIWTAGDLAVFTTNAHGERELVGVYSRGVSQMQMYTGESVVAFLASMVSPPDSEHTVRAAGAALADTMVAARADDEAGALDVLTRDALAAMPAKAIDKLATRAQGNKARAAAERDRFEYDEWVKGFAELKARAQDQAAKARAKFEELQARGKKDKKGYEAQAKELEDEIARGELGSEWQGAARSSVNSTVKQRSFIYKVMTSKAMKILAVVTGGALAITGIGALAGVTLTATSAAPLVWAVHAAGWLYAHAWPAVLKDAAYRVTLLKSCFVLSAFVPALHIVGMIYGKAKGWTAMKAKAVLGIRAYAALQLPFWVRLARIVRQPNLMPALRLGINPFAKIEKDSAIGRAAGLTEDVRPGLVKIGADRAQDLVIKRKVLDAIAMQKVRQSAYTSFLANVVVGERYGIDPVTMIMARSGKMASPDAAKLLADPAFIKEWLNVERELASQLRDMKSGAIMPDLTQLDPKEVLEAYRSAKVTAEKLAGQGKLGQVFTTLKQQWKGFGSRMAKGAAGYGIEENEFLKHVDPSDAVVNAAWQQFITDYLLTIYQMGLVGGRADMTKPDMLAANEHGILFTNKSHFTDTADAAVSAYGISNPAGLALVFQKETAPTEDRYDPIEKITMEGVPRIDTFTHGMLAWAKGAFNLRKADYGTVFMKGLTKKFKTLQAVIILSLVARMALAGQGLVTAITGFWFMFFIGVPGSGWPWMPITQGNATYTDSMSASDGEYMRVKLKLAQGLRLKDQTMINDGYNDLTAIYSKAGKGDLPKNLRKGLAAAEEMLSIPENERLSEQAKIENFYGQAARLREAIDKGDEAAVRKTYDEVRSQYGSEVSEQMKELNARSLLELSLREPPFRNKVNPMITWTWTTIGSIVTTLLGTALLATSYGGAITLATFLGAIGLAAKFYAGTYFGQKLINKVGERLAAIRAYDRQATAIAEGKGPKLDVPATYEEYRSRYIEQKAAEFKVDPKDIEASIDVKFEAGLKRRFAAETASAGCQKLLLEAGTISPLSFGQKMKALFTGKLPTLLPATK